MCGKHIFNKLYVRMSRIQRQTVTDPLHKTEVKFTRGNGIARLPGDCEKLAIQLKVGIYSQTLMARTTLGL